jgi:hypothetical protein
MTHKTRYFLVGSGLLVGVGLCTGLVAYYNGNLPLRSSTIGPAELTYVPADTVAIAYADVHDIMGSEFHQRLQQVLPHGEEHDRFVEETGIDVQRDLQSVMAVMMGADRKETAVFLRGNFTQPQIERLAMAHGAVAEDYRGKHMLVAPAQAEAHAGQGPFASPVIAFLEPGLIALGGEATIKRAIDVAEGPEDVTSNAPLMKLVAQVDDEGNAWLVGRFDAVSQNSGLSPEITNRLPALDWLALSAQIDRGVRGELRAEAKDQQSADQLRAVVNGAVAAAKMMSGQDPKVVNFLDSLQATGSGTQVEVGFTVPPEVLDQLTAMHLAHTGLNPAADSGMQH